MESYGVNGQLLQVIFKVLRDALMQVHTVVTLHVVTLAGVDKEIGLCAGFGTGLEER